MMQKSKSNAREFAVTLVGIAMLMVALLSLLTSYLSGLITNLLLDGGSLEDLTGPAEWALQSLSILAPLIVFLPPYLFLKKASKPFSLHITFGKGKLSLWLILPIFLGLIIVSNSVVNLLRSFTNFLFGVSTVSSIILPSTNFGIFLYFIATCIMPALCEEIFFRGAVQGLLHRWGFNYAIFTTSILFMLMHSKPWDLPVVLIASVLLGYVAERTASVLPCIILHFANNFTTFFVAYLQVKMDQFAAAALVFLIMLVLIAFVIGAALTSRKLNINWKLQRANFPRCSALPKYSAWFKYIGIIGFIALFVNFILRLI